MTRMKSETPTIAILKDLVAFDTTSRLSNIPLLDYASEILRKNGVEPQLIWNEDRTKANLWASIGPDMSGGIILSGHTDAVPVDGQEWSSDPFKLEERDGRLFARGSCDMKGFLAAVLASVPECVAADLKRPIHIAFSHDEELGCIGVKSLIDRLRAEPCGAAFCIVGEPTDMRPVIGRAPGQPGLWLDYGHNHYGLTLGPVSGRLLADMITGATSFVDPTPFRAERFLS